MFGYGQIIKVLMYMIIVVSLLVGAYYVMNLKADLVTAQRNAEELKKATEAQTALIKKMEQDFKQIQEINADLNKQNEEHKKQLASLQSKFNQSKNGDVRDFGKLAISRTAAIERIINRASKNVNRCMEILSGSPRTEKELNAKLKSEINNECPHIANPNYTPTTP